MRTIVLLLALSVGVSMGCGSTEGGPEGAGRSSRGASSARGGTVEGDWFIPAGSPSPQACVVGSDCLGDTVADPAQPCCNDPHSLVAHSRAYRTAVGEWRIQHCADVTCPPPPAPDQPPACAFEVRCAEGRCTDSCPE